MAVDGAGGIPPALRRLFESARSLVTRSRMARVSLARLDGIVVAEQVPGPLRARVMEVIADAVEETARPVHRNEVDDLLKAAWGDRPGKVLDEFEAEPFAAGPHAQVHRGELDGTPVAVKVLRPGLAASARSELSLLDVLAAPAAAAFPKLSVGALIREVRERSLDELDLEHEANVQRRASRALRGGVEGVEVAAVRLDLAGPDVLVCDFVKHPLLADSLDAVDRAEVARRIVEVYAGAPRAIGSVLANARARDVAVAPDGTVWLLHLSAGREVDPLRLEAALGAVKALRLDDAESFALAVQALGILSPEDAAAAFPLLREIAGDLLTGPAVLDADALLAVAERADAHLPELFSLATRATLPPEGLWVGRALGQTVALLAQLGVEEDWVALGLAAAERGWGRRT